MAQSAYFDTCMITLSQKHWRHYLIESKYALLKSQKLPRYEFGKKSPNFQWNSDEIMCHRSRWCTTSISIHIKKQA